MSPSKQADPGRPPSGREADREPREYGHSSGDRNTKKKEGDFEALEGGEQRDADPEAAT
ncbi:hypothetical protein [Lysobacter sp. A3-1-A15]|uniref:hypothetical protein n=1 Tax=Novilysobacter viscosus TaxID=3098602 RepID=UPI002ED7C39C